VIDPENPITAGTDPVDPPKCKTARCRNWLPKGTKLLYCGRCHGLQVKRGQEAKKRRMFPGVDIDRIHYLRGAVKKAT
jgi:hypothetical protein